MSELEKLRPAFHFTARKGWINDPNGLVFYDGEYHLFFQHNPASTKAENMHWGHAVSRDLLRWEQLPEAIAPDEAGVIWSGSAVVDWNNSSGLGAGDKPPLVCCYTSVGEWMSPSKGSTIGIAYSNDRGRTVEKFGGNPVLREIKKLNRDPKVIWHEPSGKWIMALYIDADDFALFGSRDLRTWEKLSDVKLEKSSECPDFFELPVDSDEENRKWVFWSASTIYKIGSFDGRVFTPETGPLRAGIGCDYAAQTFSDVPESDGRRIQMSWLRKGEYPGMPFNQQMGFPCELFLKTLPGGVRMCRRPIREIENLHMKTHRWKNYALKSEHALAPDTEGELFDIMVELEPADSGVFIARFGGHDLTYDFGRSSLSFLGEEAPVKTGPGRVKFRLLIDKTSLEVFIGEGDLTFSSCFLRKDEDSDLEFSSAAGETRVHSLEVREVSPAF